jgi:hypothetical protein
MQALSTAALQLPLTAQGPSRLLVPSCGRGAGWRSSIFMAYRSFFWCVLRLLPGVVPPGHSPHCCCPERYCWTPLHMSSTHLQRMPFCNAFSFQLINALHMTYIPCLHWRLFARVGLALLPMPVRLQHRYQQHSVAHRHQKLSARLHASSSIVSR